jgi:phenylpropionate dioxygenase-like ring-hydroxylating dioxygenase large terminal subunit
MQRATQIALMRRLLARQEDPSVEGITRSTRLSVDRYLDPQIAERERERIFRRHPVLIAHVCDLASTGDFVRAELADVPLLVLRTDDGVRTFVNACRHRGARLVDEPRGCKRALVCPYHAWIYRLDGQLMHVPHLDAFEGLDPADISLAEVPCEVRHGFVWAQLEGTLDVAGFLGPALDADFTSFGFDTHTAEQTRVHETPANWKLVMDAFAEGYHLKSLHRSSLARFFLDLSILDPYDPHIRQVGARKSILEMRDGPEEDWDFRAHTTLFYNVFPNTIFVFHPLFISQMTLFPAAPDRVRVVHRMLVPEGDRTEEEAGGQTRSFLHIDGQVFQKEDFAISASIQSTLAAGPNAHVLLGGMEEGMRLFHAAWQSALDAEI